MQIMQLNDTNFTDPMLPKIGSFGLIPKRGLQILIKLKTDLSNSGSLGGSLSYAGNASVGYQPTLSGGILTVPNANAESKYNAYLVPSYLSGISATYAGVFKLGASPAHDTYLMQAPSGGGVNIYAASSNIQAIWNNGSTRNPILLTGANPANWNSFVVSVSDTGIRGVLNGGPVLWIPYSGYGGAPSSSIPGRLFYCGGLNNGQGLLGQFAAISMHDGSVSDTELSQIAEALRYFALTQKNIVIGAP